MVARTTAVFALLAASSDALSTQSAGSAVATKQLSSHTSRRHVLSSLTVGAAGAAALFAPNAAFASGVSLEEAAKNAEKYRVKGKQCTPTNPADCTARYNQMLDPRAGRTKEELAAMDRRDAKELSMLETMLSDVKYEVKSGK